MLVFVCIHVYIYNRYTRVCLYVYVVHTYICMYIHMHVYIYAYTYTVYIYMFSLVLTCLRRTMLALQKVPDKPLHDTRNLIERSVAQKD